MSPPGELSETMPIVLTATVSPQGTSAPEVQIRLEEYCRVLEFCLRQAPVIFLENSSYPLEQHPLFKQSTHLKILRFEASSYPERGKGFQEFEMLDNWLAQESFPPKRWLKISGRYQILNLPSLYAEASSAAATALLIDQLPRSQMARTYAFCVNTEFYRNRIAGLYKQCDDRNGEWIERVLFRALKSERSNHVQSFSTQPRIRARAGSSGAAFPSGPLQWSLKQALRRFNRLFDRRYLWYAK
jgi:hypothetical protein